MNQHMNNNNINNFNIDNELHGNNAFLPDDNKLLQDWAAGTDLIPDLDDDILFDKIATAPVLIHNVSAFDVLFSSNEIDNTSQPGNQIFANVIRVDREAFQACSEEEQFDMASTITNRINKTIGALGGRFLKQDDKSASFVELTDADLFQEVIQVLFACGAPKPVPEEPHAAPSLPPPRPTPEQQPSVQEEVKQEERPAVFRGATQVSRFPPSAPPVEDEDEEEEEEAEANQDLPPIAQIAEGQRYVLATRGGECNNHPFNKTVYLKLCQSKRRQYLRANNQKKREIAMEIRDIIMRMGARFLQKKKKHDPLHEMTEEAILQKIMMNLRTKPKVSA